MNFSRNRARRAAVLAKLEAAMDAVNAAAARGEDVSAVRTKLERIVKDVRDLHEALGPFGEQMGEAKEAAEAIEASVHILMDAVYHPIILPAVAPVALSGIAMGLAHYCRALDGMRREAPDAVERAAPVVERLRRDAPDDFAHRRARRVAATGRRMYSEYIRPNGQRVVAAAVAQRPREYTRA